MILVRDVIQVKVNQMDKVLGMIRAAGEANGSQTSVSRILTDLSGPHFTLVIESKAESMDAYWERMQAAFNDPKQKEAMGGLADLMQHGHRTFYTIEYESEG